jgi:5-bromo-4-chloroindolyl phosphate hydrolysis protein
MGLHLNIDAIAKKNAANLTGKRKMGFLINEEDMLTKEEKLKRQANNKEKYGLTKEEVKEIKKQLPPPSEVEIFSLDKILNSKKAMSTIEKIVHL